MKKIVAIIIIFFGFLTAASVYNASYMSESVIMIFLGNGLIGFAAIGRKMFIKKG